MSLEFLDLFNQDADSETVPKRAKSAWVYYIEAQSATVKTENPTAKGGETFKILSERWKKLSTEEKQVLFSFKLLFTFSAISETRCGR